MDKETKYYKGKYRYNLREVPAIWKYVKETNKTYYTDMDKPTTWLIWGLGEYRNQHWISITKEAAFLELL